MMIINVEDIIFFIFLKQAQKERAIKKQDSGRQKIEIGIAFKFFQKKLYQFN